MNASPFQLRSGALHAENVAVEAIADAVGTPFYLYSHTGLTENYRRFDEAFAAVPHRICYSVKANSHLAILKAFAQLGSGFDIVSGGELFRVLQAGASARDVVFSGAGKTAEELAYALDQNVFMINVESVDELKLIDQLSAARSRVTPVSLRLNPDIDAKTHPYITTGRQKNKFGIDIVEASEAVKAAQALAHIDLVGVDCHIGSNIKTLEPFRSAVESLGRVIDQVNTEGGNIRHCDVGGGVAIPYEGEDLPTITDYARTIIDTLEPARRNLELILEPGRPLIGNAGMLICRVLYVKRHRDRTFVVVDAGMNDFIRPCLYDGFHRIEPVRPASRPTLTVDVVGPICEQSDFLGLNRELEEPAPGELLAVRDAGAYGFGLASRYNTRPLLAEVLVQDREFHVIRARETLEDLIAGEVVPPFLADAD